MNKVFVYGTLKRGGGLHHYLSGAEFVGAGFLAGFDMFNLGWFPGIVKRSESQDHELNPVMGEVFLVDDETLKLLDEVESAPSLYKREELCLTVIEPGLVSTTHKCWTYIYNSRVHEVNRKYDLIESGSFPVRSESFP